MSGFNPFAAAAAAMEEGDLKDSVMQVLNALPPDSRRAGASRLGEPGKLEAALGFDPETGHVRVPTKDELEALVYRSEGLINCKNLSPGQLTALVCALNKLPNAIGPSILAAILFAVLPILILGFASIPPLQQAAFVALLIPSAAGFTSMRNEVECIEMASLRSALQGTKHANVIHDEGEEKKRSQLVMSLVLRINGRIEPPRTIGCLPSGKTGFENYKTILHRAEELGMCKMVACSLVGAVGAAACEAGCTFVHGVKSIVSFTLQTVDGAGGKTSTAMFALGLLFTIFCECHCCNLISNVYSNGFGVPVAGSQHVFNLLFNVFNLMITHITKVTFFVQLAVYLNMEMERAGGEAYKAAGSPQVVAEDMLAVFANVDIPAGNRWEACQLAAKFMLSGKVVVEDPNLTKWLDLAGFPDVTIIPMLIAGIEASYLSQKHRWWNCKNPKTSVYGTVPLAVSLISQLQNPCMKVQLEFIVEIFDRVLQVSFMNARAFESGGGACQLLKHRLLRVQLCESVQDVKQLNCWATAVKLPDEGPLMFFHASSRVLTSMLAKSKEHLERSLTLNLPVALGDPWLGPAISTKLLNMMGHGGAGAAAAGAQAAPTAFSVKCGKTIFKLKLTPDEIAEIAEAAIEKRGGIESMPWHSRLYSLPGPFNILAGHVLWEKNGNKFDSFSPAFDLDDLFFRIYAECFTVGNETSLKSEGDVNMIREVSRAVKGSLGAYNLNQRMVTEECHQRLLRAADNEISIQPTQPKRRKERLRELDESVRTYFQASKSKTALMFLLNATSEFAGMEGLQEAARALKGERKGRKEVQLDYVQSKVATDVKRHESKRIVNREKLNELVKNEVNDQASFSTAAEGCGLCKLTTAYTKEKMAMTLAVRAKRKNDAIVVADYAKQLEKQNAVPLRKLMVAEFFGDRFKYIEGAPKTTLQYAPVNSTEDSQLFAVKQAIKHSWVVKG